jgi:hypothetical protein
LVSQYLNDHRPLVDLASEAGITLRCAYKWLTGYRSGGVSAMADTASIRLQQAVELRHQRLHLRHIARLLAAPFYNAARALNHLGLGRLRNLDPLRLRFCEAVASGAALRAPDAR